MKRMILGDDALKISHDFYTACDDQYGSGEYIMSTTTTNKGPLRLSELTSKILDDVDNLDWVRAEGYWDDYGLSREKTPEQITEQFESWKRSVRHYVTNENAAIERIAALTKALKESGAYDKIYPKEES